MMKNDKLLKTERSESISYFIVEDLDSVFVPDTQNISSIPNSNFSNGNQETNLEESSLEHMKSAQENMSLANSNNILHEFFFFF